MDWTERVRALAAERDCEVLVVTPDDPTMREAMRDYQGCAYTRRVNDHTLCHDAAGVVRFARATGSVIQVAGTLPLLVVILDEVSGPVVAEAKRRALRMAAEVICG